MNIAGTQLVIDRGGASPRVTVVSDPLVGGQFCQIRTPPGQYDLRVESHAAWDTGATNVWVSQWQRAELTGGETRYFIIRPQAQGSTYLGAWDLIEVPSPNEWKDGANKALQRAF